MSGFFGSTRTSAKSEALPTTRLSELTSFQLSPASSERYRPSIPLFSASQIAYIRFGSLGATAMPMRPSPSEREGNPFVNGRQFEPPSEETKRPLPGPL